MFPLARNESYCSRIRENGRFFAIVLDFTKITKVKRRRTLRYFEMGFTWSYISFKDFSQKIE